MSIVKLNNKAVSNATVIGSISSLGSMTFIKKLTASASATLSFVDGTDGVVLDDTYKEYVFTFKNIHPETDFRFFTFNMSTDGGSNYNVVKTSTAYSAYHLENDSDAGLSYQTGKDLAQSTDFQILNNNVGNVSDENISGSMSLFNPSSSVFVKHFISNVNENSYDNYCINTYIAGYGNTQSVVNAIQFKFDSGSIDAGDICLYGIA